MNLASTSSRLKPNVVWVRSFVPKLKKSACVAISSADTAARGSSIIVPMGMSSSTPSASHTSAMTASTSARSVSSSGSTLTSGIMISGSGSRPSFFRRAAAVAMARVCMAGSSG